MFMIGIVIFLVGSALSGLSQNMEQLILFRGIQGIGAGALFPIALAIIGDLFSPAERGKYQGLFGAVFGVAFVAGPLIGGWLTEHVGWNWIFYVNIPIGIVALFVISRLLPTVKNARAERNFDILGGVIFTIATTLLLIGLTQKGLIDSATNALYDWTDWQVGGLILVGLVGYLAFIWAETRAKEPIVPLHLFRNRTYASSMVSTFFAAFAFFGAIVFLPRWFQIVQGFSPTNSGLAALPLVIGLIGSSIGSGLFVARTGRYKWLLVGAISLMAVAMLLMTQLRADTPVPVVWLWMFIAGLGVGPTFAVFTLVVQNAVPFHFLGVATSNLTFFRQIGGSVALAIVGTVFSTEIVKQLARAGRCLRDVSRSRSARSARRPSPGPGFQPADGHGRPRRPRSRAPSRRSPADDVGEVREQRACRRSASRSPRRSGSASSAAVIAVVAALGMKELALRQQTAGPGSRGGEGRRGTAADGVTAGAPGHRLTRARVAAGGAPLDATTRPRRASPAGVVDVRALPSVAMAIEHPTFPIPAAYPAGAARGRHGRRAGHDRRRRAGGGDPPKARCAG